MEHLYRLRVGASLVLWSMAVALAQTPLSAPVQEPSVTIGAENDAAPWSYPDGTGFVNDLVREAFRASGWTVHYQVLPYARCKRMAQLGDLVACFSASQTAETEKDLQFPATPVFAAENRLFANADSPLTGCDRAQWGRKIALGVVHEYEYLPVVDALLASGDVRRETTLSEVSALRMLHAHRTDAALITTDAIKRIDYVARLAGLPPDFKMVCHFGEHRAYIAFSRRHPQARAALQAFDRGMAILKRSGALGRLQTEWAQRALRSAKPEPD